MLWLTIVGTVSGVAGLGVSIYLIFVTRDARDAARGARALARTRNLVEELEGASQKIQQVGTFIQQDEWMAVRLRSEEILAACQITLTRWPDHLSEERRNEVISASALMRSIAKTAANFDSEEIATPQKKRISDAQVRASSHISSDLPPIFSPRIMRLSPVFVRPTCLSA